MRVATPSAALALVFALASVPAQGQATGYKIVAHPSVSGNAIPKALLADIFLGRLSRWGDGKAIAPVDQSMTSPVRAQFSDKGLGQPTMAVNHHWMRQIQSGRRPPIVKNSDAEVIAYVASHEGAIGYVSVDAAVPDSVKVIEVK